MRSDCMNVGATPLTVRYIECFTGGSLVPDDPALLGLEYTAQGLCGGTATRLSNALVQTLRD